MRNKHSAPGVKELLIVFRSSRAHVVVQVRRTRQKAPSLGNRCNWRYFGECFESCFVESDGVVWELDTLQRRKRMVSFGLWSGNEI